MQQEPPGPAGLQKGKAATSEAAGGWRRPVQIDKMMPETCHQSQCVTVTCKARPATHFPKGRPILELARKDAGLAPQQLYHLPNSHSGGEAVGVHDQVWADALFREWHVLLQTQRHHSVTQRWEAVSVQWAGCRPFRQHKCRVADGQAARGYQRTWFTMQPTTPFCPWRLLNLSPSSGRRVWRINTCSRAEVQAGSAAEVHDAGQTATSC